MTVGEIISAVLPLTMTVVAFMHLQKRSKLQKARGRLHVTCCGSCSPVASTFWPPVCIIGVPIPDAAMGDAQHP